MHGVLCGVAIQRLFGGRRGNRCFLRRENVQIAGDIRAPSVFGVKIIFISGAAGCET